MTLGHWQGAAWSFSRTVAAKLTSQTTLPALFAKKRDEETLISPINQFCVFETETLSFTFVINKVLATVTGETWL